MTPATAVPRPAVRPPVRLTENQRKVIEDKYLKGDAGPEAWLERVARNVALAELLHAPEAGKWRLFEGVKASFLDSATKPGRSSR